MADTDELLRRAADDDRALTAYGDDWQPDGPLRLTVRPDRGPLPLSAPALDPGPSARDQWDAAIAAQRARNMTRQSPVEALSPRGVAGMGDALHDAWGGYENWAHRADEKNIADLHAFLSPIGRAVPWAEPALGPIAAVAPWVDPLTYPANIAGAYRGARRMTKGVLGAIPGQEETIRQYTPDAMTTLGWLATGRAPFVGPTEAGSFGSRLPAPHIANPDAPWHVLSGGQGGHTIPQFDRDAFEQHIGGDPQKFLEEYIGGKYYDPTNTTFSAYPGRQLVGGGHSGMELHLQGGLIHPFSGEPLGQFERTFYPGSNEAYHDFFEINPKFQGRGYGRTITDNMMDRSGVMPSPMNKFDLDAGLDGGGHAWQERGYLPTDEDYNLEALKDDLWSRINHLTRNTDISPQEVRDIGEILNRNARGRDMIEPEVVHDLTDAFRGARKITGPEIERGGGLTAPVTMSIDKHMLRGQQYAATFNRANKYQMGRFNASRAKAEPTR